MHEQPWEDPFQVWAMQHARDLILRADLARVNSLKIREEAWRIQRALVLPVFDDPVEEVLRRLSEPPEDH